MKLSILSSPFPTFVTKNSGWHCLERVRKKTNKGESISAHKKWFNQRFSGLIDTQIIRFTNSLYLTITCVIFYISIIQKCNFHEKIPWHFEMFRNHFFDVQDFARDEEVTQTNKRRCESTDESQGIEPRSFSSNTNTMETCWRIPE